MMRLDNQVGLLYSDIYSDQSRIGEISYSISLDAENSANTLKAFAQAMLMPSDTKFSEKRYGMLVSDSTGLNEIIALNKVELEKIEDVFQRFDSLMKDPNFDADKGVVVNSNNGVTISISLPDYIALISGLRTDYWDNYDILVSGRGLVTEKLGPYYSLLIGRNRSIASVEGNDYDCHTTYVLADNSCVINLRNGVAITNMVRSSFASAKVQLSKNPVIQKITLDQILGI